MNTSNKIKKSKESIIESQSLNVTAELSQLYYELLQRPDDKHFKANIFVQIVAANESFFKENIAGLINFNSKFLENSKNLIKRSGTKIELDDILNIANFQITLGDLIAYSLKYSSFESVLRTFKEISGLDILCKIEKLESSIIDIDDDKILITNNRPLDKGRIIKNINEVYEIRNIICHDFISATHNFELDTKKIIDYILDTILIQHSIIIMCSDDIYSKYIPLDYSKRIEYLTNIYEGKSKELEGLYELYGNEMNPEHTELLNKSIIAFNEYLEADSALIGGSDLPFQDLGIENKILLIEQRITNIKDEIRKNR